MVVHGDYFLLIYCLVLCTYPANHKIPSVTKYKRNPCKNHKVQLSVTRMLRKCNRGGDTGCLNYKFQSLIFCRTGIILLVREFRDREAENGSYSSQLAKLFPRHMKTGEYPNSACILFHTVHQPHIPAPCGYILMPEELIADKQCVNCHGLIGLLHLLESIKSSVRFML